MSDRRGSGGSSGSGGGGVPTGTGGNKKPSEKSYILENKRAATTKADPKQVKIINFYDLRLYENEYILCTLNYNIDMKL